MARVTPRNIVFLVLVLVGSARGSSVFAALRLYSRGLLHFLATVFAGPAEAAHRTRQIPLHPATSRSHFSRNTRRQGGCSLRRASLSTGSHPRPWPAEADVERSTGTVVDTHRSSHLARRHLAISDPSRHLSRSRFAGWTGPDCAPLLHQPRPGQSLGTSESSSAKSLNRRRFDYPLNAGCGASRYAHRSTR